MNPNDQWPRPSRMAYPRYPAADPANYLVPTDAEFDANQASRVAYSYSLWSHRRAYARWKGFIELSLSDVDVHARAWLDRQESDGVIGEAQDEQSRARLHACRGHDPRKPA